jgi:O-antigen/teichoic acid export membrane protein
VVAWLSIARRSIASISWNVVASLSGLAVGFVRSLILARLLPVPVFGIYALAGSIVGLSGVITDFGMSGAFLHRAPETEDEDQAAAAFFTLQLIFVIVWATLLCAGAWVFTSDQTRTALLLLTVVQGAHRMGQIPRMILVRRVIHRRLALLQTFNTLLTSLVAVGLAWRGVTLWALLATDIVALFTFIFFMYVWRPVWRPRLAWIPPVVRYFLRFGSRNMLALVLLRALDRVDDLWTGAFLGKTPLGYYSRAYAFATYPREILAEPVNAVAGGTYAELKGDRLRLSQAFFRTNAFLVRSGFYLAGVLALAAPEFIRLALSSKWLPMLDAFRLMLVYTLFDPMKETVANLYIAVGEPEQVVRARSVQLVVLVLGLFFLGRPLGIAGVALAVDLMLVVGIALLLWQARAHVDFSAWRLFAAPGLALLLGVLLARGALTLPKAVGSDWLTAFVKIAAFSVAYGLTLIGLERRYLLEMLSAYIRRPSPGYGGASDGISFQKGD